ncbi:MAG TPA: hypothetical protein VHZ25_10055 [Acidobacteriaceae bacterium]|jgi:hypothetical protein|nr:hypothetical protein [Acidobacteriaceae bacterium]
MGRSSAAKVHRVSDSVDEKASPQKSETSVHPSEPDDPKAAGGAQTQQQVLGLNVGEGGHGRQHPEATAGQHATGSFTDGSENKGRKRG